MSVLDGLWFEIGKSLGRIAFSLGILGGLALLLALCTAALMLFDWCSDRLRKRNGASRRRSQ